MQKRSFKAVHLESEEDTGTSTNLGIITLGGMSYNLPEDVSKTIVSYSAEYVTDTGYSFDHWETTGLVFLSDANANPTTVTVSGDGTLKAVYASHHDDYHYHEDYAPMVIPINDETITMAPVINCTIFEGGVWNSFHYPCHMAQTTLMDDDWSNGDANYTYVFEDWTDYDWNDIVVSLYAITNDMINVEICLEDREATWNNPFGVEITPESLTVDVHWNSTDYPGYHVVRVNPNKTVGIELFANSNPGDTAFITIIPLIPPVASFIYSPLSPQVSENVTFNASISTPNGGYIVSYEWDFGDDSLHDVGMVITHNYTTTGTYNVTLNVTDSEGTWDTESKMITVTPRVYTLTITLTSGGTTDPAPGAHDYGSGSTATVTAIPDPDYYFGHWVLNGSPVESTNPINVLMDSNHDLEAVFTQGNYTLTITTTTGGTTNPVPGGHVYSSGTNVLVTATPQDGYIFVNWELDGFYVGSANSYTVTMDKEHTLHAVFGEAPPPVGGRAMPIDNLQLLVPETGLVTGICLVSILVVAM
ncbi:MAG: PKD domain-containing protein, partial [Candidatus Bathyarchaeota archaeon]|nr:PKD domain-containing protein [Candidatus Bathyarchaeota archaeon]